MAGLFAQPRRDPNASRQQGVVYSVVKSEDSMFGGTLRARTNGKTYTLTKEDQGCLVIVDQRDWDGNGLKDALVKGTACGGNCCPDTFFFVSAFANGQFKISDELADSWTTPVIEKWKGRWSVVIVSTNEGYNTDRPVEITRRFVLDDGRGVKVEESQRKEIPSILEMRSEIFNSNTQDNEEHSIQYDLDGDGKPDVIRGTLWSRWGRIVWRVEFADGKEFSGGAECKRIGVLATKTNGVHDLVCDQDGVYRWNGQKYH